MQIPDTESEEELYEHHRIIVDAGQSTIRIDKFLVQKLPNVSRTRVQTAAEAGSIRINDKPVKSSYKIKPGETVTIVLPEPPRITELIAEDIPIEIIYEDDEFLIVNKQAGMVVHPALGNYKGTLVNALLFHCQHLPTTKGNEIRPGLVHRIDKDTSGLLVISKTDFSATHLSNQFFYHTIKRKYIALVWGDFEKDNGTVKGYINRHKSDRKIMCLYDDESKGKIAITHYKVIERLGNVTLIECKLETGRTHQIRASMKHIGHPLFADAAYGGKNIVKGIPTGKYAAFIENCFSLMPRQALHAKSLGFIHPKTEEEVFFESELPEDFNSVLEKWRKYSA